MRVLLIMSITLASLLLTTASIAEEPSEKPLFVKDGDGIPDARDWDMNADGVIDVSIWDDPRASYRIGSNGDMNNNGIHDRYDFEATPHRNGIPDKYDYADYDGDGIIGIFDMDADADLRPDASNNHDGMIHKHCLC